MKLILFLSDILIPLIIFAIVGYGVLRRHNIYEEFVEGAKEGMHTVIGIMPTLIGLMTAVGILRASGFLDFLAEIFSGVTKPLGFPSALLPLAIVKMFSSSAATGLLLDIFKEYGADSFTGRTASILMSCTETIFYTMSVYFMSVKIKKSRYTLAGALLATLAGTVASVVLAGQM
jgi:spore maturation protein B